MSTGARHRVTIGLPVYNGEPYLVQTLDSLLAQTFDDFELIIADNASTDATQAVCRSYAARDGRIRYFRNDTNIGVYRNCNSLIRRASGEFFKLACADDLCDPTLVARCVEVLDSDPGIVATYAQTRFIDGTGEWLDVTDPGWHLVSDSALERMRYVIASGHWVNLFFGLTRMRCLSRTRLFPQYPGSDCSLLGELCLMGRFVEIPEYLFFRRLHPQACSQNTDPDWQSRFFKGRTGSAQLPLWQVCFDHVRTITTSALSAREKRACLGMVAARMVASKRTLLRELCTAGTYLCYTALRTSDRPASM